MPAIELTPADRKDKRGLAHHLSPVVLIGADGLTAAVEREVDLALSSHGLIKVRMFSDDRAQREAALTLLADKLNAAAVQHIGKLLVLWRPPVDKPQPQRENRKPGPRVVKVIKAPKHASRAPEVKRVTVLGNERITPSGLIKRARTGQRSAKKKSSA